MCVRVRFRRDGVSSDFSDSRETQSIQLYTFFFFFAEAKGLQTNKVCYQGERKRMLTFTGRALI